MHTLSRPLRAARLLAILREVDLGALKHEAEGRFALHLSGDPQLAARLAEGLSATPGRSGVHPYLVQAADAVTGLNPDLRIVVQQGFAAVPPDRIPTLVVCIAGGALPEVGAEVARPGETARVAVSALTLESVQGTVVPALLRALPAELHLAVARQLPVCRPAVIRGLIEETSRTNALYAAGTGVAEIVPVLNVPLNVADTVVLTKNQLLMAYKVALAAGKTGKPQELVTEIVGVLGGGLLFRQAARGLVGLVPLWGLVPKVAVAYAGTQVIGTVAALWATEGRTVSAGDVQGLYREALGRGRALAERLSPLRRGRTEALPDTEKMPELEPPKED